MGCHILEDKEYGKAVFYCSTVEWAFGPGMPDYDTAEEFQEWLDKDPRMYTDKELESKWYDFRKEQDKEEEESS